MAQDPKDIFTKVSDIEARLRLAGDLVRLKSELTCKTQASEELFVLEASRLGDGAKLVCVQSSGAAIPKPVPESVIVSFGIGAERYFLMSDLRALSGGYFELDFSNDVFHLQRRQTYRIRIPDSRHSTYEIGRLNGEARLLTGAVHDISSGGARLLFPHDKAGLKVDDLVEGVLNLGQRVPLAFKGQVRHIQLERADALRQLVGIEFQDLTPAMENRLFSITMELHRELFLRWGNS